MFGLVPLYSSTPEDKVEDLNVLLTLVGIVPIDLWRHGIQLL
jgi:hypothetical protein